MMKVWNSILCLLFFQFILGQELTTNKVNKLLSRKKRYLLFPKGANFIYAFINVKILMIGAPKYIIWFNEWTVVFPLPYDPAELRELRRKHRVHRRHLHENFAITLARYGLNGTACVNRMICEAREFIPVKGKSLIKDMLYAVFSRPEDELTEDGTVDGRLASEDVCHISNFEECTAPLLHIMLGSLTNY